MPNRRVMTDQYIIKSEAESPVHCLTERQALQKAAELFDRYGPDADIEIYLNELSAESILYSREWMRQWNGLRLGHR
jgi:hypothetical protein